MNDERYLELLAEKYPTEQAVSREIINLTAILSLPKGTEHFITDIHGEYEAFSHVLKNGSGSVKKKIDEVFGHTLTHADKKSLATLIYYPQEKMDIVKKTERHMRDWYKIVLYRLITLCKTLSSKYTRAKVRAAMPQDYAFVMEELTRPYPRGWARCAYRCPCRRSRPQRSYRPDQRYHGRYPPDRWAAGWPRRWRADDRAAS